MRHRRVRHISTAAFVCAAVTLLPGSAAAHPVDCGGRLTEAPNAERFSDWTGGNSSCGSAASMGSFGGSNARSVAGPARKPATRAAQRMKTGALKKIGHEKLMSRGMNSAIAVHGDYAYVGSRTDGGHPGQHQGGILVVDISDPSDPTLLGRPFDAKPGESSRELRVWKSQDILIVLNTNCGAGPLLHHCTQSSISNIRFYDIAGANATRPRLLNQLDVDSHEFFLWQDPANRERALIFAGNAGSTCATRGGVPSCPFSVWDISPVRNGQPPTTSYSGLYPYSRFPALPEPVQKPTGGLHSLTISNDGSRAYFALLTGGFAVVDVSEFAAGAPFPQPRPITSNEARPVWAGPGAHSAAKLWGRDWAWVSDEVYGTATGADHGCPWGWARMIRITDPQAPTIEGEYREPENDPSTCDERNPPRTSYSAHNPTLTPNIAFTTWHSGGMEAVSIQRARRPYQLAEFTPKPLDHVMLEDPRLSSDPDTGRREKVVMWSYPIIRDGLIYVIDLRNGLYVLEYRGPFKKEVRRIRFLEGNSNQGNALCYEPVGRAPRYCR